MCRLISFCVIKADKLKQLEDKTSAAQKMKTPLDKTIHQDLPCSSGDKAQ